MGVGAIIGFSPHAWGWTSSLDRIAGDLGVFPTRVGVDPIGRDFLYRLARFPHTRGGGPDKAKEYYQANRVFPTRVGVDPIGGAILPVLQRFPHTRGGGPICDHTPLSGTWRFPHTRGGGPIAIYLRQQVVG